MSIRFQRMLVGALSCALWIALLGSAVAPSASRAASDRAGGAILGLRLGDGPSSGQGGAWPSFSSGRQVDPAKACTLETAPSTRTTSRESRATGGSVDACGRFRPDDGATPPSPRQLAGPASAMPAVAAVGGVATIDSMLLEGDSRGSYSPWNGLHLMTFADRYYLSDGTSWPSGAGSATATRAMFVRVETSGDSLRFILNPPADSVLYRQTDYDGGDHSAQGTLTAVGPLVLETRVGEHVAVVHGLARIAANDMTWYGEPAFNFYSALVGAIVPFTLRYDLGSETWSPTTMEGAFSYSSSGKVDFSRPVSSPALLALTVNGPSQIPDRSAAEYVATATHEGGVQRNVTSKAIWSVTPSSVATVTAGRLVTGATTEPSVELQLTARYTFDGVTREVTKAVLCRRDLFSDASQAWPTFQANARHDGYVPVTLAPANLRLAWSSTLGGGGALSPVTAADGRVFCVSGSTLYAVDSRDGHTMWSRAYSAFSINPPACAYGNVYLQTCNHSTDTWLHAYDGATGDEVFRAPHSAQWERYYAPTPFAGSIYIDGGYYGGAYAFDALSGVQRWFVQLPQYDEWTPAVDSTYVYAYLGEYDPGLYVARRADAAQAFMIPDPAFSWNGWSMKGAPVLGSQRDVLAGHDGRLLKFDLVNRTVAWQQTSGYSNQPSLGHGIIYVVRSGQLAALDEGSGATQWTWAPARGALAGTVVVTDSHVFAASSDSVFAIDLSTHRPVWAYAASGALALGNGQLYAASANGRLTAFDVTGPPAARVHADAGRDTVLECADLDGRGTPTRLDGSASTGDSLAFEWSAPGVTFDDPHSQTPIGRFPRGTTDVALRVENRGGVARDTVRVRVADTHAPELEVMLDPRLIWPPDRALVPVHASVAARDGCDHAPTTILVDVAETELGVEGSTADSSDVQDAAVGTADFDILLRADRHGAGRGRLYTVCYEATDQAGNRTRRCEGVLVPHDRSGRAALSQDAGRYAITIFGSADADARAVEASSVVVRFSTRDALRAAGSPASFGDVDGDGAVDAVIALAPVEGAPTGPMDAPWARWRAGGSDFVAALASSAVAGVEPIRVPTRFAVDVAPNPGRASTAVRYALPSAGRVRLRVFDVAGRCVATLVDGEQPAGEHVARFRPADGAASRLYFYVIDWNGIRRSGKFVTLE